jgi:glycosyltransferase involved in cell wall biosynthesis
MTPQPLVSIVTPSFNQGRYLRRTIESVLGQTYPHIEYLVLDGGSRDDSVAILESYGARFSWVSEPDRGQTHALNKGFARARGEIRAYLNSDDVLLPDAVATAVEAFAHHADWDLLYGTADYIDPDDRFLAPYETAPYSFERLMLHCCICQPAAFWRTRMAERVGPFNEQLHFAMDYEYWLRIARAGGVIAHVPRRLACSRLYPEAKSLAGRREAYYEAIAVCLAQGGYAERRVFDGLWHHLCWERTHGWPRLFRCVPKFCPLMAQIHHKWTNRHRYTLADLIAGALRGAWRRIDKRLRPGKRRSAA